MSLIGSASLTFAVRIVLFALSLVANIILARSLGPTGRGVYAVAVLLPTMLALVSNLGIGSANVYHVSRGSLDKRELVSTSLVAALSLGVVAYALLALIALLSGGRPVLGVEPRYLLIGGLSLPFSLAAAFMQGVLHGERRFVQLNAALLTQSTVLAAFLVLLLFVPADRLVSSIAAWTVSWIASGSIAAALVRIRTRLSLGLHLPTMKGVLRYGFLAYLGTLTSFLNYRFDVFIVNAFSGPTQVGLYAVGAGLAEVIWFLPNSAAIAIAPRVAAAPEEESSNLSAQATRSVVLLTVGMALVMAAVAPLAISVFFGAAFAQSAVAVWLLLPGIVTFSAWKMMSCYLLARNFLKQDLVAVTVAMIVTLGLDLALIPKYGFRGAAVASSIAYTIAMLIDLNWVIRLSGLSPRRWLIAVPADSRPIIARVAALMGRQA